ncbi:hypothetical protein [Hymenobacter busanensis]|uniref:hypothetical protein n=1 Tax=Hymenobacter busanensis TaxID=2607656 RepID=UPI001F3C3AA9|nr:hypothetical protein [Hymenobacter busanensis]
MADDSTSSTPVSSEFTLPTAAKATEEAAKPPKPAAKPKKAATDKPAASQTAGAKTTKKAAKSAAVDSSGQQSQLANAPAPNTSEAKAQEEPEDKLDIIFEGLKQKSSAKQSIFRNTEATFDCLRKVSQELVVELTRRLSPLDSSVLIEYRPINELEFHIKFSGDLLVFVMHSNIITFPDDFPLFNTKYVLDDFRRRFFGHIMAYNFMADSIKYQRMNDPGYLVGRLLVNIDHHYFIEGVKQLEMPDHDMADDPVTDDAMRLFVESAMIAAVNNDLIAPPIQDIQKISVKQKVENQQVSRGSKVGFSFRNEQRSAFDGLSY